MYIAHCNDAIVPPVVECFSSFPPWALPADPLRQLRSAGPAALVFELSQMDLHRARLLLSEEETAPASAPAALRPTHAAARSGNDEEEYVPLKRRRLQEAHERSQRGRGAAAAPPVAEPPAPAREAQTSLLVRAAELKRDKPQEDEATRLAREELEILRSITVCQWRPAACALGSASLAGKKSADVRERTG